VEIDPAILNFGKLLHPESPYDAKNVNPVVNDARAFIRYTDKKYDLIVYGLLDSHTLLAGTGGVRLDSYVYTVEAFREARARLKEGGMICLNFCVMSPGMGRKLFLMLQEAFDGKEPLVYDNGYDYSCTFITGENITSPSFPPDTTFTKITDILKNPSIPAHISTDDWPFFYMPERKYPVSYLVMIIVLLIASVIFIRRLIGGSEKGFSIPCFFLGAGFMLIETKGITELALVFGSTWIVIGLVISAILIMAFLANLLVIKKGSPPAWITYILLVISLLAGLYLTSLDLSNFPSWVARSVMTFLLTLPLFFSGFAFSGELKKSPSVAVALYSNLLGSMLGGFLEYNSMYFGFDSLYFFAIAMYIFAFLGSIRNR